MPYADPIKQKDYDKRRYPERLKYWREYHRKNSTSKGNSLGYNGEELALKVLVGSKRIYHPSDLEWTGKKVEVKTSIKYLLPGQHTKTYRWKFYLKRQIEKVDLFFLICEDKNKKVEYIFLIPNSEIKVENLSIPESKVKKYSRFLLTL